MKTWIYKDKNGNVEKVEYHNDEIPVDDRTQIKCSLHNCINPAIKWYETPFGYSHRCDQHLENVPYNASENPFSCGPLMYDSEGPYRAYYDDIFWNNFELMGLEETKSDFLSKVMIFGFPSWSLSKINSTVTSNLKLSWNELDSELQEIIKKFRIKENYS